MPELRHTARFAQKAIQLLSARQVAGARHFNSDGAVKLRVSGLVDGAERAVADSLDQLELAELLARSALAARRRGGVQQKT
jgi:hypothetical protein